MTAASGWIKAKFLDVFPRNNPETTWVADATTLQYDARHEREQLINIMSKSEELGIVMLRENFYWLRRASSTIKEASALFNKAGKWVTKSQKTSGMFQLRKIFSENKKEINKYNEEITKYRNQMGVHLEFSSIDEFPEAAEIFLSLLFRPWNQISLTSLLY